MAIKKVLHNGGLETRQNVKGRDWADYHTRRLLSTIGGYAAAQK